MTTQTESHRIKFATPDAGTTIEFRKALALISDRDIEWQNITGFQQRTLEKMQADYDARIAELEAANAKLREALKIAHRALVLDGFQIGWSVDRLADVIAKHGGTP
jgi:uncharacterized membrane protein